MVCISIHSQVTKYSPKIMHAQELFVKTSCQSIKAIILYFEFSITLQIVEHCYRFFDTYLIVRYQKWEENLNSGLKSLFSMLTCELKFLQGKICVSASCLRNVLCLNLAWPFSVLTLRSILVEKIISPVIFDPDHSFKR